MMEIKDVMGTLYSSSGLRFGGIQTEEFLDLTEPLLKKDPEVREKILEEAHHYINFILSAGPEILFTFTIWVWEPVWTSLLAFLLQFMVGFFILYPYRSSSLLSKVSRAWTYLKVPTLLITTLVFWPTYRTTAIVVLIFLFLQGFLMLGSAVLSIPARLFLGYYAKLSGKGVAWANLEFLALLFTVKSYYGKLSVKLPKSKIL
ncbi:MAG TPA: hypothetical protein VJ327_01250 [Patescibacteria group bacterium]|nr:hypothetical protein [Patescibacteria group bacterium]